MHENNLVDASGLNEARRGALGLEVKVGVTAVEARLLGGATEEIDVADKEGTMDTP